MEEVDLNVVNRNLINLIKVVEEMREDLEDRFLTAEEARNIEIAEKELKEGKTISLEDMKKELGL